jgi:hypothetical protein
LPPGAEIIDPQDPEILRARLGRDHADLMRRFVELEQGAGRIPAVRTEADAQRIVDFVAQQCTPLMTEAKQSHTREKKPYLQCSRVVDEFFLRRIDKFNLAVGAVKARADQFLQQKKAAQRRREEAERLAAAERQRQAAAEAARLEAEAQKKAATDRAAAVRLGLEAQEAADRAAREQAIAEAPGAPVRLHGDFGAVGFEKQEWDYEVDDPSLGLAEALDAAGLGHLVYRLGYLVPDDAAVKAAIADGVREIAGLRIFQRDKFIIRRC